MDQPGREPGNGTGHRRAQKMVAKGQPSRPVGDREETEKMKGRMDFKSFDCSVLRMRIMEFC